jgi:hypothetical protein
MDTIREQVNKPIVVGIIGLVVGIILGVIYGWVINPVEWTDASVEHLRSDLQEEYMRMAIDSFAVNQDVALAQKRYNDIGENAEVVLASVASNPDTQDPAAILAYQSAIQAPAPIAPGTPAPGEEAPPEEGGGLTRILIPVLCVAVVVAAGAVAFLFFWRSRSTGQGTITPAMQAAEAARQTEYTDYESLGEDTPMVQFVASYKIGDDLFDDSFSVDSPSGEFLGECGVGISETVGIGDPKKVTAFEVWLFDKNDIQTVTKVLMSAHAFLDEDVRQRLAAKGEPVLSDPGSESVLETQTLRLVARVVDMAYGEGALPDSSFFDHLVLELAVWPKA